VWILDRTAPASPTPPPPDEYPEPDLEWSGRPPIRLTNRQWKLIRQSLVQSASHTFPDNEFEYLALLKILRLETP
jgi:hypothetical protein